MANVPGTQIEKPAVDLTKAPPFEKVHRVKKALRRARVPENVIGNFITAAWASGFESIDQACADYAEVTP